jgi:hypothetical protein
MSEFASSIPGIDEAMSFAELMKYAHRHLIAVGLSCHLCYSAIGV